MLRNNKFKSILTNTDSHQKVLPDSNNFVVVLNLSFGGISLKKRLLFVKLR